MTATSALLRPALRLGSSYGLDLGGDKYRDSAALPGKAANIRRGLTRRFGSLTEFLLNQFRIRGYTPEGLVLALPGSWEYDQDLRQMRFTFTNLQHWPSVTEAELAEATGARMVTIINDMQAAQLGARFVDRSKLLLLKDGIADQLRRHLAVVTFSTGINWATGPFSGGLPLAREMGHVRLATDPDTDVRQTVDEITEILGIPGSIENLLSGKYGVPNLVAANLALGEYPGAALKDEIDQARKAGRLGPMMTHGAIHGADFWDEVAKDFADLMGLALNQLVVGELVGELFIQGSVVNGTPGFAEWLFSRQTGLMTNLLSANMEKAHVPRDVQIWAVPNDLPMAAIGAQQHAASLLQAA